MMIKKMILYDESGMSVECGLHEGKITIRTISTSKSNSEESVYAMLECVKEFTQAFESDIVLNMVLNVVEDKPVGISSNTRW